MASRLRTGTEPNRVPSREIPGGRERERDRPVSKASAVASSLGPELSTPKSPQLVRDPFRRTRVALPRSRGVGSSCWSQKVWGAGSERERQRKSGSGSGTLTSQRRWDLLGILSTFYTSNSPARRSSSTQSKSGRMKQMGVDSQSTVFIWCLSREGEAGRPQRSSSRRATFLFGYQLLGCSEHTCSFPRTPQYLSWRTFQRLYIHVLYILQLDLETEPRRSSGFSSDVDHFCRFGDLENTSGQR